MSDLARVGRLACILPMLAAVTATSSRPAGAAQNGALPVAAPSHTYADCVVEAARRFGLQTSWLWAVMRAESGGDPRAVSRAGAMGLMQVMPATWRGLRARYALGSDPYDVHANVHAGAAYLREMLDRYGDLGTALAAYNAGPGRVDDWLTRARSLPAETSRYVTRVASAVGRSASPIVIPIPVPPISWRNATLFTVRGDGASANGTAAVAARSIDSDAAPVLQDVSQYAVANPLFVARSGRGAP